MHRRLALTLLSVSVLVPAASAVASPAASSATPKCLGRHATIVARGDHRIVHGTRRADVILALGRGDKVYGAAGDDRICAGPGAFVDAGAGNDQVRFSSGTIHGGAGNDVLTQTGRGNATVYGDAGNDVVRLKDGTVTVHGGPGNDRLFGAARGRDRLLGEGGNDILLAAGAITTLDGGPGADAFVVPASVAGRTTTRTDALDTVNGQPVGGTPATPTPTPPPTPAPAPTATGPLTAGTLSQRGQTGLVDVAAVPHDWAFASTDTPPYDGFFFQAAAGVTFRDWAFDGGDGTPVRTGSGPAPAYFAHDYYQIGRFTATVRLHDTGGQEYDATIGVDARPSPTLSLSGPPGVVTAGSGGTDVPLTLASSLPIGSQWLAWEMFAGDDSTPVDGTGTPPAQVTLRYATPGVWQPAILAIDDHGHFLQRTTSAVLADGTARAHMQGFWGSPGPSLDRTTLLAEVGSPLIFGFASSVGPHGEAVKPASSVLHLGNGTTTPVDSASNATVSYAGTGNYTLTGTLAFVGGASAALVPVAVNVAPNDGHISLTTATTSVPSGTDVSFDTTGTHPATGTQALGWSLETGDYAANPIGNDAGDGAPTATLHHVFVQPGVYLVSLSLADDHGGFAFDPSVITLTVTGAAPFGVGSFGTGRATPALNGDTQWVGATQASSVTDTDHLVGASVIGLVPSTGHTAVTATVAWGDGSPSEQLAQGTGYSQGTATAQHAYTAVGDYLATLAVTDSSGQQIAIHTHISVTPASALAAGKSANAGTATIRPSYATAAGTVPTYWDVLWGDGNFSSGEGAPPSTLQHTYAGSAAGKAATLEVANDHGDYPAVVLEF